MDKVKTLLMPSFCPGSTELAKAVYTSSAKQPSHSDIAITVGDEEIKYNNDLYTFRPNRTLTSSQPILISSAFD